MKTPRTEDTEEAPRSSFQSKGLIILKAIWLPLWVLIGYITASFLIVEGARAGLQLGLFTSDLFSSAVFNAVSAGLLFLLTAVIVIGGPRVVSKSRTSLSELGLDRLPSWFDILLTPAAYVMYFVLSVLLVRVAASLVPGFNLEQAQEVGFENLSSGYEILLAFLTLVVLAPVAEEVLMRGYLYGKLRKIVPVVPAILITSVLFAFLHGQWNVAIDVFALSLVLTSLREITGNIWAAILLHMVKNGIAFYLLFINPSFLTTIGM